MPSILQNCFCYFCSIQLGFFSKHAFILRYQNYGKILREILKQLNVEHPADWNNHIKKKIQEFVYVNDMRRYFEWRRHLCAWDTKISRWNSCKDTQHIKMCWKDISRSASFSCVKHGEIPGDEGWNARLRSWPVSYTHLTLPTNREV